MPSAVTKDNFRLHFEEAGSGTPIIFLHEFAADHTNWEPQMRYFSRGHRCIAYSARGYTPSDVPPSAEVYTYKHFYTDALAVLDHLDIAKAHFVGLSMGSYSSLQIGLNAPERALSMTLAAVGSGSSIENLDAFRAQCRANAEQYESIGSVEVAKATREAPSRIPFLLKDPRGHADFYAALARHDARGSANTMRSFQGGRPSIYTLTDAIRKVPTPALILCGDEDDNCIAPSLFLKQHLPAAGLSFFPKSGHVLNLEEPSLFNEMVERFIALVEAGRWPVRDPRSMVAVGSVSVDASSFRDGPKDQTRNLDDSGLGASTRPGMTRERLNFPALPRLSRNTPCSPNMFQNHQGMLSRSGPAVEIERDRALHLDVDLVAELHEILDGAEVNVRRVVPGGGEVFRARHVPADQQLQPHLPEAEIRERDDGALADAQQVFQHRFRLPRCLQRLRQDHVVEGIVGIIDEVGVGVALHHRQPLGDAAVDALARQLDAAAVDAAALQELQQLAVAAADVEHLRAVRDHFRDQQMVAAIFPGAIRSDAASGKACS